MSGTGTRPLTTTRSPFSFFVLVCILSLPLWLVGENKLPLPVNLPASALTAFVPMTAAAILSYRQHRFRGVKALFRTLLDYRRLSPRWYLLTLLLAPFLYLASFLIMRLTGLPLPERVVVAFQTIPAFFALYFVSGVGEELGWTVYALNPMQRRWGWLKASFLLGLGWAAWHSIGFLQTGNALDWVLLQSGKTVAMRMVIVWIYNRSGKNVIAGILYHTADNVSWSVFPNYGSHYHPLITGVLTWLVVGLVTLRRGKQHAPDGQMAR